MYSVRVARIEEAEVIARVAGRVHRDQFQLAAPEHVPIGERLRVLAPCRRVEAVHGRTGFAVESQCEWAMVGMGVGQQDRRDPAASAGGGRENRGEVAVVVRSRIDADDRSVA